MRYWLCCDGGGTKLISLLVNEDLNIVDSAVAGGVNPNFLPKKNIRQNMDACIQSIARRNEGLSIKACYISMPAPLKYMEKALADNKIQTRAFLLNEGLMGLMAGICAKEGFAALSGTGSDVFYESSAGTSVVGGWGILLGDEGSGADIGRNGLIAAIHALDGRGEPTSLTEELCKWLGRDGGAEANRPPWELTSKIYDASSPRTVLASFVPCVANACERGDKIASKLFVRAGEDMGRQMVALIRNVGSMDENALSLPSTLCGGVWKASGQMYRAYRDFVHGAYPEFQIHWPLFDAVAGAAVYVGMTLGYTPEEIMARMRTTFQSYRFPETV